jgi:ABC-type uncharacterized transport system auxiliary subunit
VTIKKRKFCFVGQRQKIAAIEDATQRSRLFIFRTSPMRFLFVPVMVFASLLLAGCASAPNDPTQTFQTKKTPAEYADCVVPKLQGSALTPTVSQTQRSYRIVVPSKIAADNILEAYKAPNGGKVFLYERRLLASNFMPSSFERAAQECL